MSIIKYDYIEGNGGYFITDYTGATNVNAKCKFMVYNAGDGKVKVLFGTYVSNSTNNFDVVYNGWSSPSTWNHHQQPSGDNHVTSETDYFNTIRIHTVSTTEYKVEDNDGNLIGSVTYSNSYSPSSSRKWGIFVDLNASNSPIMGSGENVACGRMYYLNIYEGDTLVREYIPASQDGVVGLLENVSGTFLAPASGTFEHGTEVPTYPDVKSGDKTIVMFGGQQYIMGYNGVSGTSKQPNLIKTLRWHNLTIFGQYEEPYVLSDFMYNYNVKNYDSSINQIKQTSGATLEGNMILCGSTPTLSSDGSYFTINNTYGIISGYDGSSLNINSSSSDNRELTIIAKVNSTSSGYCDIIGNRVNSNYNYMIRISSGGTHYHDRYHDSTGRKVVTTTVKPSILVYRINSSNVITVTNITDGTSATESRASSTYAQSTQYYFFAEYCDSKITALFQGDIYWVYSAKRCLTDDEVQEVINYNEK